MYAWCITSLARVFSSLLMRAIPSFLPLGFSIQSIFKTCIHLVASIRVGGGADVGELSTSLVSSFSVLSCPFRMIATMSCFKSHAIVLTLKFCINKRFKSYIIWKFNTISLQSIKELSSIFCSRSGSVARNTETFRSWLFDPQWSKQFLNVS